MSGNPMMARLENLTKKGKVAEKSASDAAEPEAKATESPAAPAKEPDAPAKSAKKNLSVIERMKAGKTAKSAKTATVKANESGADLDDGPTSSASPATEEAGINPPKKNRGRAKLATAKESKEEEPRSSIPEKLATAKSAKVAGKSKKTKKVTTTDKSTLLNGGYPVQGAPHPTQLHDLLADVKQVVCEANDVPHWGMIKYTADAELANALDLKLSEEGVPPALYAEPFSSESRAVEQVLLKHYDVVVRGLR